MEFRYPSAVAETNAAAMEYLTSGLKDKEAGKETFNELVNELGNVVDSYPEWHPVITTAFPHGNYHYIHSDGVYKGVDHTRMFVRGFVTCPYSEERANKLVKSVNSVSPLQLTARRLDHPLYHDKAYPVVVVATDIVLEGDGTICSRDALFWCAQKLVKHAENAQVAETWWNVRSSLLGSPHGSRSSVLVNQHTGIHMRKILEAFNNSGLYGPIKEESLEMLSAKKRRKISETLLQAAISSYRKVKVEEFEFTLRDETCRANVRDIFRDGTEYDVHVEIGGDDLRASGLYHPKKDKLEPLDPRGKRALAEKFLA